MRVTVHTLGGSLMLYHDGGCRALVKSLLAALCQHYGECVCVYSGSEQQYSVCTC